jgi:hypothetical protein
MKAKQGTPYAFSVNGDKSDYKVNKDMNGASLVRGERTKSIGSLVGLRKVNYRIIHLFLLIFFGLLYFCKT